MTPEDLARARAEHDEDLAVLEIEGVEPGTLEPVLTAETDRYSDLDCDHGAALAAELAEMTEAERTVLAGLSDEDRAALWEAAGRG